MVLYPTCPTRCNTPEWLLVESHGFDALNFEPSCILKLHMFPKFVSSSIAFPDHDYHMPSLKKRDACFNQGPSNSLFSSVFGNG